jgi:hypothetical protein
MIWNVPDFIEGLSEKQPGTAKQGKTLRNRSLCKVKKHTQTAASTSWPSAGTFQTKPIGDTGIKRGFTVERQETNRSKQRHLRVYSVAAQFFSGIQINISQPQLLGGVAIKAGWDNNMIANTGCNTFMYRVPVLNAKRPNALQNGGCDLMGSKVIGIG